MAVGQLLGPRSWYLYTGEDGATQYLMLLDDTLAGLTGTGLVAATTANSAGVPQAPKRFKPRVVFWQINGGSNRKNIICGTKNASLYASNGAAALTIDGDAGTVTGRRGEFISFANLPGP